ncbi:MAG: hypothetical protein QG654_145, partial [Patescibacteria group bacterium]|nr:hypothetical protein [Patescibacteria group bacterium]
EIVAKYVRENIVFLAPEDAVLGGTFYALGVKLDPFLKTGVFSYEDGHIMGSASFSYTRNGQEVLISDIKKIN